MPEFETFNPDTDANETQSLSKLHERFAPVEYAKVADGWSVRVVRDDLPLAAQGRTLDAAAHRLTLILALSDDMRQGD